MRTILLAAGFVLVAAPAFAQHPEAKKCADSVGIQIDRTGSPVWPGGRGDPRSGAAYGRCMEQARAEGRMMRAGPQSGQQQQQRR
jgi:hypothetical protein